MHTILNRVAGIILFGVEEEKEESQWPVWEQLPWYHMYILCLAHLFYKSERKIKTFCGKDWWTS